MLILMEYHKQPQEPGIPMHLLGTAQRETLAGFWWEVSVFKKSQAVIQKGQGAQVASCTH